MAAGVFPSNWSMVRRVILAWLLAWAVPVATAGAEAVKTIRSSSFFLTPIYHPLSEVEEPGYSVFTVPAGVEVELLAYDPLKNEFVTVRLPDGSIGFMSVLSFADARVSIDYTRNHVFLAEYKEVPEGDYSVVVSGAYKYRENRKGLSSMPAGWTAGPEKLLLKGKGGKTFDLTDPDTYEARFKDEADLVRDCPVCRLFTFGELDAVLQALPESYGAETRLKYRYKPRKNNPVDFAGCSKSYLESVFGLPYAYAGPGVSEIPGYTYALYDNILSKSDSRVLGEKLMDMGTVVYYDRDLVSRAILNKPFGFAAKRKAAPLVVPWTPLYGINWPLIDSLYSYPGAVRPVKLDATAPGEEKVSKPGWVDRLRIDAMSFYERTLGLQKPWQVACAMLLVQLLLTLLIICWIRYIFNYGSNDWARSRCLLLPLPIALLNLLYLWRYPLPTFLIAGFFVVVLFFLPYASLLHAIDRRRCPKCHRYTEPTTFSRREGVIHGGHYRKTNRWEKMCSYYDEQGDDVAGASNLYEETKYETVMSVSQDVDVRVLCPHCGHKWFQLDIKSLPPVRGPIMIEITDITRIHSTTTTIKKTTLKDEYGAEVDSWEEVEGRSTETSTQDNSRKRYDLIRYKPYFDKYINGDKDALDRYYEECWDDAAWGLFQP